MTLPRQSSMTRSMAALVVSLALAACGGGSSPTAPQAIQQLPRPLTADEQQVIAQSNGFAFSLFHEVAGEQPDSNIFMSPLSASMALGMTMNGAMGSTLDAMRSTLGFASMSLGAADTSYESLIALLRGLDPHVDFQIADAIWYRREFEVNPAFLQTDQHFFDATVQGLDFNAPSAAQTINSWVSANTKGKITEIVQGPIDPATVMFLTNAIYFKGTWHYQFDPGKTSNQPFHAVDGSPRTVPMMDEPEISALYARTATATAVELPYGGGAFAMDVVLPNEGTSLDAVVTGLAGGGWQALLSQFGSATGEVQIPRFTLAWGAGLKPALGALGMGIAFGPDADFGGISSNGQLSITQVEHKAFVAVNEQGTTAAAATNVGIGVTTGTTPFVFRADRPFLFVIRERLSGAILFVGQLNRPPSA
jgi:serine protease inhibitor